jgi:hypothetical protein
MSEADPLKRVQSAARRAAGSVSVETQKRWYRDDLHQDLGLDAQGKARGTSLNGRRKWLTGARLLSFLLLTAVASVIIFAVHLSRDGRLEQLLMGPKAPRPDISWMGGITDKAAALGEAASEAVTQSPAPENFYEPNKPAKPDGESISNPAEDDNGTPAEDSLDGDDLGSN